MAFKVISVAAVYPTGIVDLLDVDCVIEIEGVEENCSPYYLSVTDPYGAAPALRDFLANNRGTYIEHENPRLVVEEEGEA